MTFSDYLIKCKNMKKANDFVKRQRSWDDELFDDTEFLKNNNIHKCANPECSNLTDKVKYCSEECAVKSNRKAA
jgi:Ser-tRNA(Ala) deacylase AlaX